MIGKKINSVSAVSLSEVKDILKERLDKNEKEVEPTYEQNLTNDYVKKFVKLTPAKTKKLMEDLQKLGFVDERIAIKIADVVPEDLDVLGLVIPKDAPLDESRQKQVLELVLKYSK
ncbi:MAG: DNA-directed RNA polymerase subunit F [archaeon]